MKLSAVIITKNEEDRIGDCIEQLEFCDEVLIIDDQSSDRTRQVAQNLGAFVHQRAMDSDYAQQRNYGLDKAKGDWVLFIDADEIVSEPLSKEILEFINSDSKANAAEFVRKNYFLGKRMEHGELGRTKLVRLGKKGSGKWKRKVHEYWDIKGPVHTMENPLLHIPNEDLSDMISKINNYSTLHAVENDKENKSSNIFKIIFWPMFKFKKNYLIHRSYKDGTFGFVSSMMMSFHSFLTWSKLWLKQKK